MTKYRRFKPIKRAVNWLFCQTIGKRYVGGSSIKSVIKRAKNLNEKRIRCVINHLGEHYTDKREVNDTVREYLELLDAIKKSGVDASISLKPTQFGFDVPFSSTKERDEKVRLAMGIVLEAANRLEIPVELDMEDRDTFDFTVETYKLFREWFDIKLLLALQANLSNSFDVLRTLISMSTPEKPCGVRTVKGIYENVEPGLMTNEEVLSSLQRLNEIAIRGKQDRPEFFVAVGSHHTMILRASRGSDEKQLLNGIMTQLIEPLQKAGEKVAIYLPYGPNSFAYSFRRLIENPGKMAKMLASMFKGKYTREINHNSQ